MDGDKRPSKGASSSLHPDGTGRTKQPEQAGTLHAMAHLQLLTCHGVATAFLQRPATGLPNCIALAPHPLEWMQEDRPPKAHDYGAAALECF